MCHEMYWRRSAAKEARKAELEKIKDAPPEVKEAPAEIQAEERKEKVPELA